MNHPSIAPELSFSGNISFVNTKLVPPSSRPESFLLCPVGNFEVWFPSNYNLRPH
jgi:hypothetical protein